MEVPEESIFDSVWWCEFGFAVCRVVRIDAEFCEVAWEVEWFYW